MSYRHHEIISPPSMRAKQGVIEGNFDDCLVFISFICYKYMCVDVDMIIINVFT